METEYLIKEKTLSIILGKNRSTLRAWRKKGKIPYLKIGTKTIRYKLSDVFKALNE